MDFNVDKTTKKEIHLLKPPPPLFFLFKGNKNVELYCEMLQTNT